MKPFLQIALDFIDVKKAIEIAEKVVDYVDIVEAGTPLIKAEGIRIVKILKERFPYKLINADTKTADAGEIEAELAFKNHADIITVLWLQKSTVKKVIDTAKKNNKMAIVDILQEEILNVKELVKLLPSYIGVHLGIDSQRSGVTIYEKLLHFKDISVPLAVAGGITPDIIPKIKNFNVGIVIVGGYITKSSFPEERAKEMKQAIEEEWKNISKN